MSTDFYLLTESYLIYCYLVEKWIEAFGECPNFKGILLAEKPPSEMILRERRLFHQKYAGQKYLNGDMDRLLQKLYPAMDESEKAMISLFGVPKYSTIDYAKTIFLGSDINGEYAKQWLTAACQNTPPPFFFIGVSQILKPWWMEISKSQVINVHSAVLPYARGMFSIENIAAVEDIEKFRQSVGTTVHYVDEDIDTGAIIRAKRVVDPFRFNSIWELKGYLFMTGFQLQLDVAQDIISSEDTIPVAVVHDPNLRGPNFKRKDFTLDKRKQAEEGYLSMKLKMQCFPTTKK